LSPKPSRSPNSSALNSSQQSNAKTNERDPDNRLSNHSGRHRTVLKAQAVDGLDVKTGQWYVDATLGAGGHTEEILLRQGRVVGLDHDQAAVSDVGRRLKTYVDKHQLVLVRENFAKMQDIIAQLQTKQEVGQIRGVLFDLGTSSDQLLDMERGFSFESDQLLDMRMDDRLGVTAADLLAVLSVKQLAQLFRKYGGETRSKVVAQQIVDRRQNGLPTTTGRQLANLVVGLLGARRLLNIHPATKIFQALRIAVNDELNNLEQALPQAVAVLTAPARLVTIAFHDGEDKLVKHFMTDQARHHGAQLLTKKVVKPTDQEILSNPRARSARLRILAV